MVGFPKFLCNPGEYQQPETSPQTRTPDETVTFPKVRLVPLQGEALRPNTCVRVR